MPVSKKPRKKGNRYHVRSALTRLKEGKFKSKEEMQKLMKVLHDDDVRLRNGVDNLEWMLSLQDKDALFAPFVRAFLAIDRWPETGDFDDFNVVTSSLMLGALCHRALGVQETEMLTEIQDATFRCVTCVRLRQKQSPIPKENLSLVKEGLTTAQRLIEFANDNNRNTLIHVLKQNTLRFLDDHPEEVEKHERLVLGRHYETVRSWELNKN